MNNIMTTAQAAIELKCSQSTVQYMCTSGRLNATKSGKTWVVDAQSVADLVAAGYSAEAARRENGRKAAKRANSFTSRVGKAPKRKKKQNPLVSPERQTAQDDLLARIAAMGVRHG